MEFTGDYLGVIQGFWCFQGLGIIRVSGLAFRVKGLGLRRLEGFMV